VANLRRFGIQCAAILLVTASARAARLPPKPVTPIIANGIRYSAEGTGRDQYVVAVDVKTCNVLWKVRVFHTNIWSWWEEDVQWVFITNLKLTDKSLLVDSERRWRYSVDLATKRVETQWFGGLFAHLFPSKAAQPKASENPETAPCQSEVPIPGNFLPSSPGPPETTISGVTINRTSLLELKKRIPATLRPKTYSRADRVTSIGWDEAGSRIHVSFTGQIARAVAVSGKPTPPSKTGRGLALGQSLDDVERIYGSFNLGNLNGDYISVGWIDGTELRVHLTADRITSMELIACVK
jgi:hypothetical protein